LPVKAQQKTEEKEQSEAVDNEGIEDKDVQLLTKKILFRPKEDVSRL
jgi:hypothetical protein